MTSTVKADKKTRMTDMISVRRESAYQELIESTGEDLERAGVERSPERAARAFGYLTQGYSQDATEILNDAIVDEDLFTQKFLRDAVRELRPDLIQKM